MTAKRKYVFRDGKELELGKRTLVMGVLNVTPDSFPMAANGIRKIRPCIIWKRC